MAAILIVEPDPAQGQAIARALRTAGHDVELATAPDAATASNRLLVVSATLPQSRELLARHAKSGGGPGALALVPASLGGMSPADLGADAVLARPFDDRQVAAAVRALLPAGSGGRQLTSQEIFGDVLAEVEAEAARRGPRKRFGDDMDRKLEQTLSGVLDLGSAKLRRPVEPAGPPSGAAEVRARRQDDEIDLLLDKTLGALRSPARPSRPRLAEEEPAAAPSVPEPPLERSAPEPPVPAAPPPVAATTPSPAAAQPPTPRPPQAAPRVAEPTPSSPAPARSTTPPPAAQPPAPAATTPAPGPAISAPPAARPAPAAPPAPRPPAAEEADAFRTQRLPAFLPTEAKPGQVFGDYTLEERIALGGMAEVWQARRRGVEGFQKRVAIKKILSHLTGSPDFVNMFIDEAKLAAQLNHNNIIQIYDLGKVGDDFFIAMEYVDGKDLRTILTTGRKKERPLPVELALLIASRLARALDYAHRKRDFENQALGLVHRDVSPQNVLISYEGEIKLCDFGIVKAVAKASTTQMGALKGKLQYMSPEQAWGKHVDGRSDIFSLGSVLYEMLSGRKLFTADSEIGVLDAVRECRVDPLRDHDPSIPPEVDEVVRKALAKTAEARYQTAGEMEQDLEAMVKARGLQAGEGDLSIYLHELFEEPYKPHETPPEPIAKAAMAAALRPAAQSPAAQPPAAKPPASEPPTTAPASDDRQVTPTPTPSVASPGTGAGAVATLGTGTAAGTPTAGAATAAAAEAPLADAATVDRSSPAAAPQSGRRRGLAIAAVLAAVVLGVAIYLALAARDGDRAAPADPAIAAPATAAPAVTPPVADPTTGPVGADGTVAAGQAATPVDGVATPAEGTAADGTPLPSNLESMVEEALSERAERIREDLEAEKQRLEAELREAQRQGSQIETGGEDG